MSAIPFEQKSIFESELLQFLEPTSSPEPAAGAEVVQQALQTQLKLPEQRLEQRVAAIKHATTRKKLEPGLLKEAQQEQQLAELAFKLVEPQLQVASAIAGSGYVKPLSQSMAIGTSFNTMNVSSRYFRVLVWNLENFTSDSRPRGSAPISRRRNQARIAAVVAAVRNFGARLLFIMETGADVGQATTDIATMLQQTTGAAWEPLTTPMTHEQPKMAEVYENVTLGRVSGRRVLALRLLGDFYDIAPNLAGLPEEVTIDQITDACHVLIDASSFVKGLGESYTGAITELCDEWQDDVIVLLLRLLHGAAAALYQTGVLTLQSLEEVIARQLPSTRQQVEQNMERVATEYDEYLQTLTSLRDDVEPGVLSDLLKHTRERVPYLRQFVGTVMANLSAAAGWLQLIEVLLLFLMKHRGGADIKQFCSASLLQPEEPLDRVPLMVFLCTGAQCVDLRILDPGRRSNDDDLRAEALRRVGLATFHGETYGIVYCPPFEGAMERILAQGIDDDGVKPWQILKTVDGQAVSIQDPSHPLNWRSALIAHLPIREGVVLPIAVYHTRYSGSKVIKTLDPRYVSEENTVLARCRSVQAAARAALQFALENGQFPPLVTGDFNIPTEYLDALPNPGGKGGKSWLRKETLRREFELAMNGCGFLRHRTAGGQHPRTTLVAYRSIASGQPIYSQSYDGVYEPLGFCGGLVRVRSAAVLVHGIVYEPLFDGLTGQYTVAAKDNLIAGDEDEEDEGDTVAADADGQPQAMEEEGQMQQTSVGVAFAAETTRVYLSLLGRISRRLQQLIPWLERSGRVGVVEIKQAAQTDLPQHASTRGAWFEARFAAKEFISFAAAHPDPDDARDPLERLRAGVRVFASAAPARDQPTYAGLADLIDEVLRELTAIECNSEVRYALAYRAVVSDHIPMLIEIDMEPGRASV